MLAMTVPHPDHEVQRATVYWQGTTQPNRWSPYQRDAARFADETLALHTLRTVRPDGVTRPVRVEPALNKRNGGPITPVITAPPAGTVAPEDRGDPDPVQGDLFGGLA